MFKSLFRLLSRCYYLALPYGKLRLLSVMGVIFLNGLLQLVGVTSVFPFFALAADPDRMRNSKFGSLLLPYFPQVSTSRLLVFAGIAAILMLILAGVGSVASDVIRTRYAYGFSHWLRARLLHAYSRQPYSYFLKRNSSQMHQRLQDITYFTHYVLMPIGEMLTRLVMIILLFAVFLMVQPSVAIGSIVLFGGFYLLVFLWLRPRTNAIKIGLQKHNLGFSKNTFQYLHAIKPIFVNGSSRHFIDQALGHSSQIGRFQGMIPIYSNTPRYLIEPIAFGGLVAIVVVLAFQGKSFTALLPNLMVMTLAGYRLLPAMQLLYGQLITIASNSYTLNQLEEEVLDIEEESASIPEETPQGSHLIRFDKELHLNRVTFRYDDASAPALNEFSLKIAKNESVGISGPSGAGKSTLVDLILGLHSVQAGTVLVDDVPLTKQNMASWRALIGYVPQDIYLLDDSVEANIAFGVSPDKIDRSAVRKAADAARILDFVEKELPQGFKTVVGERGVRLSGGQRQRIGLARALYSSPQILILDEATSALDHSTEEEVMETIHGLQGSLTMITIAHRLSTLDRCDKIIQMGGE
jgi:ATP-binding cassette subfamily C protein